MLLVREHDGFIPGGGIYYGEFKGFTVQKYTFFILGVLIIFIGVGILATRLASIANEEKESEDSPVASELV